MPALNGQMPGLGTDFRRFSPGKATARDIFNPQELKSNLLQKIDDKNTQIIFKDRESNKQEKRIQEKE